jgi:flavin reductase (DIM6/NTAB) family NADH-FMN oxidoreductase RutF/DNA-binding IclR family transcriptional regulator
MLDSRAVAPDRRPTDPKWFRQVLGQYPTGVCVITAQPGDVTPAGMAVGSFTSVSLDPPLVAFFPDRSSTSWPKIRAASRFCVNILSADQEHICRRFASKAENKFEGLDHRSSNGGPPIISGVVAWMDCDLYSVQEAGDHFIVLGLVRELQIESASLPLLFFQGGYGRFAPSSLAAPDPLGVISEQLRHVDIARAEMERLAADLSARCIATARVGHELVIAASAGNAGRGLLPTLVGQRLPFMPPTGSVFAAWNGEREVEEWLESAGAPAARATFKASLKIVRERGYSLGLRSDAQRRFISTLDRIAVEGAAIPGIDLRELIQNLSYDPAELSAAVEKDVRLISAPIFGSDSTVLLALSIYGFPKPPSGNGIGAHIHRLLEATARVALLLGGAPPKP